ncbi:MAG: haloalkane dehalogenase [Pseudomonadota bacterium]
MDILRTPDERFANLPDYPFAPHYTEISDPALRVHYVDEGPRDGPVILLMHGQPSWSYLYRFMIPGLAEAGCRVLAPDLIGFGKSDKPSDRDAYSYEQHVTWMTDWLSVIDPHDVTLFCQDWGGLIGLRLLAGDPDRFAGLVVSNTGLPIGQGKVPAAFKSWLEFSQTVPILPIGGILQGGSVRTLTDTEVAAYDAPFPDETYKAGARAFPKLVPITPEHPSVAENLAAWGVLSKFDRPVVTAFSDQDPITRGGEKPFQERMTGAKGQPHVTIESGGHFVQEDQPEALVQIILDTLKRADRIS